MRAVVAFILIVAFAAAAASAGTRVRPATFGSVPNGWSVLDGDYGFLTPRGASAGSTALSWRYKLGPVGWATEFPHHGIAVIVLLLRTWAEKATGNLCGRTPHYADYPLRRLPLRLPRTTVDRFEGPPAVPEYRIFGRIDDSYNFEVRVDINERQPTAALFGAAQRVVSNIRFPVWPHHC
jgi:hypothetical protein